MADLSTFVKGISKMINERMHLDSPKYSLLYFILERPLTSILRG
jgi:hypothetical protein